jgi:uncharacterized protein
MKKRFLFYLVHPAKFQFHKVQINELKERGHQVDILINTKDILEDLVLEEGWEYTNIFPNGRRIKGIHAILSGGICFPWAIYRLWKYTKGKKYDLFIGDALGYIGRIKGIPTLYPTDDVLAAVPQQRIMFIPANYIIAPNITDIGSYENRKIAYNGYKALAHLHPNHFHPNKSFLFPELQNGEPYFLIRCTGFMAIHDLNKSGISDDILNSLVDILQPHGRVFISSERKLPKNLEKLTLNIRKNDMTHYIAFAKIFISDSTTMSTEAAVLGTPSVELDEYFYEIEQMLELERKYGLINCFRTNQSEAFLDKIQELVNTDNLQQVYNERRSIYINETIDVSAFLIWLYENYPESKNSYFENPDIQNKFK